MIMLCVLVFWSATFWSHEFLQPRTYVAFPYQTRTRLTYRVIRLLGPCCALAFCLIQSPTLGVLYWLGLGGVAGVGTSLLSAGFKQKRGLARVSKPSR
ncbi:hypothetical protein [Acetobacter orleanensis]|uniref:hypothetical protein n=1 Tax=Acetobacter orleanensis TaxID=104099 RepID=UPI000A626DAC|nr:hypothetical protein [Acetobacter orleanensis]